MTETPTDSPQPQPKHSEAHITNGKVIILFRPTGSAPELKQSKFKLSASANFQNVIDFLRKQLRFNPGHPLFLFINRSFQPAPDEIVSDLFKCFHSDGKLVISYCSTPAWG